MSIVPDFAVVNKNRSCACVASGGDRSRPARVGRPKRAGYGFINKRISDRRGGVVDSDPRETSVSVYVRDVVVHRGMTFSQPRPGGGVRGVIQRFSEASRRRLMFTARNVERLPVMLTLTYPASFPTDGEAVKRHWSCMRKWLGRRGIGGLMILEFQERGAPHIHAYLTGPVDKLAAREAWYGIVGSGDVKHLQAGTRVERIRKAHGMLMYVLKYATKLKQKDVPDGYDKVGRFWSLFGGVKVEPVQVLEGERSATAPIVRLVRGVLNARRRVAGVARKQDWGHVGFQAWDVGPALLAWARRVGLQPNRNLRLCCET